MVAMTDAEFTPGELRFLFEIGHLRDALEQIATFEHTGPDDDDGLCLGGTDCPVCIAEDVLGEADEALA